MALNILIYRSFNTDCPAAGRRKLGESHSIRLSDRIQGSILHTQTTSSCAISITMTSELTTL